MTELPKTLIDALALPLESRLHVLVELFLNHDIRNVYPEIWSISQFEWGTADEIGSDLGDWAKVSAAQLTAVTNKLIPMEVRWPTFLALTRAGVAVEPEWDPLLPVGMHAEDAKLTLECLNAIPEERRELALVNAVRGPGTLFAAGRVKAALELLTQGPGSSGLLQVVFDDAVQASEGPHKTPEKELRVKLDAIAERHPSLRDAIASYRDQDETPTFQIVSQHEPALASELSSMDAAQLARAGELYDGEALSATARLAADGSETSFLGGIHLLRIADDAGHAIYDAWLMIDSGTFFAADTLEVKAEIIQFSVTTDDLVLRKALIKIKDEFFRRKREARR